MVGRAFLPDRWAGVSAFSDGRIHCAAGGFSATVCAIRADRHTAPRKIAGQSVVGISRVHLACCLRRVRSRLHRGCDVPRSGAPTQDAPFAFDFLPSSAPNGSFRRDHPIALVGVRALYARIGQWIFCRRTFAVDANHMRDRRLVSLRIDFTGPIPALVRAETGGCALHHWF